jgi:F0F1-type ATP synthase assembly protein I
MPTKDQAKTIKNYIEVFFAAFLIVSSLSFLVWNQGNHFSNSGAIAFFIAGVLMIIKANWEYKQRKHQKQEPEE